MTVHALANGQAMCGRKGSVASWPPDESWASAFGNNGVWTVDPTVTCRPCRERVAARVAALEEAMVRFTRTPIVPAAPPQNPPPAYVCPRCERASWNPNDAKHRYCGACGFEDDAAVWRSRRIDGAAVEMFTLLKTMVVRGSAALAEFPEIATLVRYIDEGTP